MNEIQYIGEHLLPGKIGHFFIVLGFVASILATVAYAFATNRRETAEFTTWRAIGRWSFSIHTASIFIVIGTIFYIMINKYYEYFYVFEHVSEDLPFKYIFSAFWEGQEGSFLLWMFWHVVLGMILMFTAKKWESPVLATLSLVEVFINSMILGLYFGVSKIGSNPLVLFRDIRDMPLFNSADYVVQLAQFADGLNPLLQNYWMTIHPPTLFLGFASTVVPFCFAIAGLWLGKHREWFQVALPWALFSGAILGTGILMGGAWAYEALSFGGYWAWDPVENTSLVPWILLVAGIHTNLVARSTGYSIKGTYAFYLLTFIMIVYSTTLTRSGVLGDSSVHAFTEMGLENQLLLFIMSIIGLSLGLFFWRLKAIPAPEKEEKLASREFWMFIGALVLLFSAILITFTTSIPVYNKVANLFGYTPNWSPPNDIVEHYNRYQLWIGVFVSLLSGTAQLMRYRGANWAQYKNTFFKHIGISAIIAIILTYLIGKWINLMSWEYIVLSFTALFTILVNLDYIIFFLKGNLKQGASTISHIGFGVMLIGILASGLNKEHISTNPFAQQGLLPAENLGTNVLLFKNMPMYMSGYQVTYESDTIEDFTRIYTVNYKRLDENGKAVEDFTLYPNALYDRKFTKVASSNPSTKHYWYKDIFSHIASLPPSQRDAEEAKALEDSLKYIEYSAFIGEEFFVQDSMTVEDSTFTKQYTVKIESINRQPTHPDYEAESGDLAVGLKMSLHYPFKDTTYFVEPVIVIRGALLYSFPAQIDEISTKIRLKEETLDKIFVREETLQYQEFEFKKDDTINYNGMQLVFNGFNRQPEHPDYEATEGDIAVGAAITIKDTDNKIYNAQPIYLIRGNRPFNLKSEIAGLHLRFTDINPQTETIKLNVAQDTRTPQRLPIEMATNSFRDDWIVLEAIVFPGINFVWLGSIMMMFGLGMGMFVRRAARNRAH